MEEQWQSLPFAVNPATRMQLLLNHATAIPPLLETMESNIFDKQSVQAGFSDILQNLQDWEDSFVADGMLYKSVNLEHLDLPADRQLLPDPCFNFLDISHANSLTHCWAFRAVCLLHLTKLKILAPGGETQTFGIKQLCVEIKDLCYKICRGLPFLLQKDMSLYGSMSAGFPLHMVSESLRTLKMEDRDLTTWCTAIKEHIRLQRIALYEDMVQSTSLA